MKLGEFVKNYKPQSVNEVRWEKRPTFDEVQGKNPEKNEGGNWAIDEPTDDSAAEDIDFKSETKNVKRLTAKINAEEDFFIMGKAGWGKTSIIKQLAKRFGYSIITVYLDKAVASDLGGIPVPEKNKKDLAVQTNAMPAWASIMMEQPEKNFLLFFDEMNQAAPDVMNALMPIVLEHEICGQKFDNFFVGAAGNFEEENRSGVNALSGPLESRFKPIIVWESDTPETWKSAFKFMHKEWDEEFGKEFVDEFERSHDIFTNPREINDKIFKFMSRSKKGGKYDWMTAEDYLDRLEGLARTDEELTRTQRDDMKKLADSMQRMMQGGKPEEGAGTRKRRGSVDISMIPDGIRKFIKNGMTQGYIVMNKKKYGISRENIAVPFADIEEINNEQIQRYVKKLENDGMTFKYEKNDEWQSAGYEDPA